MSTTVPGRARFRMRGLRDRPLAAARVEDRIATRRGVRSARVNALTGSVLVLFDSDSVDVRALTAELARHAAAAARDSGRNGTTKRAWHAEDAAVVATALGTRAHQGLAVAEAERRLEHGANRVPEARPRGLLAILGDQMCTAPVLVLAGAAALSIASGALLEAAAIAAVVVINTVVGGVTEYRVDRILNALQPRSAPHATVVRDGIEIVIPAAAVVPGDVLALQPGEEITADARVVETDALLLDESTLTGESLPVIKQVTAVGEGTPLAERHSMVWAGTAVSEGRGLAIVTATGRDTELGRTRTLLAATTSLPTPLARQLDRANRRIVGVALAFCGLTVALGLVRGMPLLHMVRAAASLGVAAIPEGLPAVATTTLALGVRRMLRRRVIVRRPAAIEALGAVTVICADKTGTLTENRMRVGAWCVGDARQAGTSAHRPPAALRRAAAVAALCNDADAAAGGSGTELALLEAVGELGVNAAALRARHPRIELRPRRDGDTWMATVHTHGDERFVALKGAPEAVLDRSTSWLDGTRVRPLDGAAVRRILRANERLAGAGMRVLALAERRLAPGDPIGYDGLVWLGLVGLTDPIRSGVREAIGTCRRAGIRIVMLTGDQAATAASVARELGFAANGRLRVVEAPALDAMEPVTLGRLVREVDVFARITPEHKHRIVRALQAAGEVVAMTGDGVNDAAALKAADVGIAMGERGTDVARSVADVVLLDDDLASIARAIEQGRATSDNIGKSVRFLLATNFSEILLSVAAVASGAGRTIPAMQLLWINLLSDTLPALALALEPPEADLMRRPPPDPADSMLSRRALTGIAADAAGIAGASVAAWALSTLRGAGAARAGTVAFSTLASAQLLHALVLRRSAPAGLPGGGPLLGSVIAGSLGLQALAGAAPPLRRVLGTTAMTPVDWTIAGAAAVLPITVRALTGAKNGRT